MDDYPTPPTKQPSYMQIVVDFNKWQIDNDRLLRTLESNTAIDLLRLEWKRLVNNYLDYILEKFDKELTGRNVIKYNKPK